MIKFNKDALKDFDIASGKEWIQTNGLGGWASSTIVGSNTRRYHGLLVAATTPPVRRMVILSKLEESLLIEKHKYDLSCNQYQDIIHPEGYQYLEKFRLDPFPIFTYKVQDVVLEKSVFMVYNQNTTVVTYKVLSAPEGAVALLVRPLVACRDYHSVSYENNFFNKKLETKEGMVKIKPYEVSPAVYFNHNAETFEPTSYWYRNFL